MLDTGKQGLFGSRGAHLVHAADKKKKSFTAPSAAIAEVSFFGNKRGFRLIMDSLEDGCVSHGASRLPYAETAAILWLSETHSLGESSFNIGKHDSFVGCSPTGVRRSRRMFCMYDDSCLAVRRLIAHM